MTLKINNKESLTFLELMFNVSENVTSLIALYTSEKMKKTKFKSLFSVISF